MRLFLSSLFLFLSLSGISQSLPDTLKDNPRVKIYLESGIEKTGYLIHDNDEEVKIWSKDFGFLKIQKIQIRRIEFLSEDKFVKEAETKNYGYYYAFSNSAIAPRQGEMYLRMPWFFTGIFDYGVTDDFSVGFNAYYFAAMSANVRYKFDFSEKSRLGLAIGTYYTYINGGFSSNSALFSARAVYTIGDEANNFSLGANYLTNFNRAEIGMVSVSGLRKITERTSFLADIFIAPDLRSLNWDVNYVGIGFVGFRIITKKQRCLDLGIANILAESYYYTFNGHYAYEQLFLPAPYLQYSFKI